MQNTTVFAFCDTIRDVAKKYVLEIPKENIIHFVDLDKVKTNFKVDQETAVKLAKNGMLNMREFADLERVIDSLMMSNLQQINKNTFILTN